MKKQQLKLHSLQINSFITSPIDLNSIKGGRPECPGMTFDGGTGTCVECSHDSHCPQSTGNTDDTTGLGGG